jgi:hypothetical protein
MLKNMADLGPFMALSFPVLPVIAPEGRHSLASGASHWNHEYSEQPRRGDIAHA